MPNITKEYYHNIDLLANQLLNSRLHNITTAARIILGSSLTSQDKGYQVFDTNLSTPFYWNGTAWTTTSATWGSISGTLSNQTDLQNALNAKQNTITLTTTGTSGAATFVSNILNIPQYTDQYTGTVNSVSAGTGMNFTTITASGSVAIDISKVPYLSGGFNTGLLKYTGSAWTFDTSTYLTQSAANLLYYPLSSNPAGYITSSALTGYVPNTRSLTINGTSYDLSANRSWTVGDLLSTSNYSDPTWITSLAWSKIISTPTTLSGYGITNAVSTSRTITINGTTYDLSANRTWSVGTVTSVAALTLGTSGTDISSTVANGTTTPVITLNIPTASSTNRGALSSTDWSTFNNKVSTSRTISTLAPLSGGGDLSANRTLSISKATTSTDGYLDSADWNTFNNKQPALSGSGIVKSASGTISYISGTNAQFVKADGSLDSSGYLTSAVTSVGLSAPSAFTVSGSPVTGIGTLTFAAAGTASQYIRGDGTLASLPTGAGGGSSVSYFLNGSVNQGTFGGNTYYQMSKTALSTNPGTDFPINSNGIIARFITDAGDPGLLNIPGGNWNLEFYFSSSSSGGSPNFYVNIYKYNGSGFSLLGSSSTAPEGITNGTTIDSYFTTVSIPTTTLTLTDRLAIEVYVNNSGRTITMHTEDSHISEIITTFSTGLAALNNLTAQVQYFQTGTSGTDFNISSVTDTHTFNLPVASDTNTGKLSNTDYTTFNNKASKGFAVAMAAAL